MEIKLGKQERIYFFYRLLTHYMFGCCFLVEWSDWTTKHATNISSTCVSIIYVSMFPQPNWWYLEMYSLLELFPFFLIAVGNITLTELLCITSKLYVEVLGMYWQSGTEWEWWIQIKLEGDIEKVNYIGWNLQTRKKIKGFLALWTKTNGRNFVEDSSIVRQFTLSIRF